MAIEIWTAEQLDNIRNNIIEANPNDPFAEGPRYIGGDYIQMADIDMSEYGSIYPIGRNPGGDFPEYWHYYQFIGNYNGNGFKIKNLTITHNEADIFAGDNFPIWSEALFARVSGGTIENVILENCNIRSVVNPWVSYGFFQGYFSIDYACAGLIGHLHAGTVRRCSVIGVVRTPPQTAGTHDLYRAFSYGNLDGGFGGLIGWARGDAGEVLIEECYTNVAIWAAVQHTLDGGPSGIGGLIGKADLGRPCQADRTPNDNPFTSYSITIKNCYSRSDYSNFSHPTIPSDGWYEWVIPMDNSITGAVQGGGMGGAIGYIRGVSVTVKNIYSTSPVFADDLMYGATGGGLIGKNDDGVIIHSYHDTETSRFSDDTKGLPLDSIDMRFPYNTDVAYIDWNFRNLWAIDDKTNDMYPFFGIMGLRLWVKEKSSPEKWRKSHTGWVKTWNGWKRMINLWVRTEQGWKRS